MWIFQKCFQRMVNMLHKHLVCSTWSEINKIPTNTIRMRLQLQLHRFSVMQ